MKVGEISIEISTYFATESESKSTSELIVGLIMELI